jgi:methylglutaconyl-CoA hydratase
VSSVETRVSSGVAHVTLNRPDKRNALDGATLEALLAALDTCTDDPEVRVMQLSGAGKVFCAGADLAEMQSQINATEEQNVAHARKLSQFLTRLYEFPKPTVARVNGDGYGGALGFIGACDLVVAVATAKFAFTEVRLGIIPAVISPFVVPKMGESAALRYFLTAEPLSAADLKSCGLAHLVVDEDELDGACESLIASLLKGAPGAQSAAKTLIRDVAPCPPAERPQRSHDMALRLARLRVGAEAQEGFKAFFQKRRPGWRAD